MSPSCLPAGSVLTSDRMPLKEHGTLETELDACASTDFKYSEAIPHVPQRGDSWISQCFFYVWHMLTYIGMALVFLTQDSTNDVWTLQFLSSLASLPSLECEWCPERLWCHSSPCHQSFQQNCQLRIGAKHDQRNDETDGYIHFKANLACNACAKLECVSFSWHHWESQKVSSNQTPSPARRRLGLWIQGSWSRPAVCLANWLPLQSWPAL